ncbi:MAG: helix-turn-helix domain-containing protein [Desulfovibrio sp.]|nr:helix-turn-helix domain-containing protein [Desulfovibrio sp.]
MSDKFLSMGIGSRIVQARGRISRREFAKAIGIVENTLRNYEQELSLPNSDIISEICLKMNISPQWLLFEDGPMRAANEKAEVPQGINAAMPCAHCLELYKRLDAVNERLYLANERERALLEEIGELKTERRKRGD